MKTLLRATFVPKSQQPVKAGAEGIPEIHHKLLIDVTK